MEEVLITGATGFLGSWIVRELDRQAPDLGIRLVRILTRSPQKARRIECTNLTTEVIEGDLLDTESIRRAGAMTQTVIHTAALYDIVGSWRDYYRSNVLATGALIEGMRPGSRLVLTSTYGVYGFPRARNISEDYEPKRPVWHYQRSKQMQEDLARRLCRDRGIRFVALRPPTIVGPGDKLSVETTIRTILAGQMMLIGDGRNRVAFVHPADAARAHLLALRRVDQNDGQAFHFYGFEAPMRDFVNAFCRELGVPPVSRNAPLWLARTVGLAGDFLRLLGIRSPYSTFTVLFMASDETLDQGKIRRCLDYEPRHGLEETVAASVAWYREKAGAEEQS